MRQPKPAHKPGNWPGCDTHRAPRRLGGAEGAAGLGQSSRPFPSPRASSKGGHPVLPQLTCG